MIPSSANIAKNILSSFLASSPSSSHGDGDSFPADIICAERTRVMNNKRVSVGMAWPSGNDEDTNSVAGDLEVGSPDNLDALVQDFLENESCSSLLPDLCNNSDSDDRCLPKPTKLLESLQVLKSSPSTASERVVQSAIKLHALSIKDADLICLKECKGACMKRLIVKHLRCSGYNAALCKSKWPYSGKLPGGEYEYIDIVLGADEDRVIVDIDFQSEFEIARPTSTYKSLLESLPVIFIGPVEKLEKVLKVMAEGAKLSLKHNSMSLPPWRTFAYMSSKWMSPYQRTSSNFHRQGCPMTSKQCLEHLRHLKATLMSSEAHTYFPSVIGRPRSRVVEKMF